MERFAKLFETKEHGQILVKLDESDEGPEVRFYFRPEGMGVCSVAITGADTEKGWDAIEAAFNEQTTETAAKVVAGVKSELDLVCAAEEWAEIAPRMPLKTETAH